MVRITNNYNSDFQIETVRKNNSETLLKTAEAWHTLAVKKELFAKSSRTLAQEKRDLAFDLLVTVGCINKRLNESWHNKKVYALKDADDKIQGIAIVVFSKTIAKLHCIATHPNNVVISGKENRVPGIGSGLLKYIVEEVLKKPLCKHLELDALPSAVGFYKKFGFIHNPAQDEWPLSYMTLKRSQMRQLSCSSL